MKFKIMYLLIVFSIIIVACGGYGGDVNTPTETNTNNNTNIDNTEADQAVPTEEVSNEGIVVEDRFGQLDYLVYSVNEVGGKRQLILFDPVKEFHVPILSDWDISGFSISIDNRIAFSSSLKGNRDIYIVDYPFTNNAPVNITYDTSFDSYPISWSPDGHYLAYGSTQADGKTLSIWDGNTFTDIYHYQEQISEISWSLDGRLAFTEFYTFVRPSDEPPSEIFIWDGEITTSVSQNPSGEDRFPAWSADGQLAFRSERDEEHDVFLWDGISKINGIPDIDTFINVAPELTKYYSDPVWTNSGSIAFSAQGPRDNHVQIYEWDGKSTTNISKNPLYHNGGQSWNSDGYWAFVTYFSGEQFIYVRDEANNAQLTTDGQYTPAWSQTGLLMFCVNAPSGWTLNIWDGAKVIEIAHGYNIVAKWRNGADVYCSSG